MAAGILSEPGSKRGPCATPCEHSDCAESRRMADTPCPYCGQPIGYECRYYASYDGATLSHAACLETAVSAFRGGAR